MAIIKCQNPQCDYFQQPVPEGEFCPFCGEPLLNNPPISPIMPSSTKAVKVSTSVDTPPLASSPLNPIPEQSPPPIVPPIIAAGATVYEQAPPLQPVLKLIHTSGQEFIMSGQKAYIGRRGGKKKPQPEIDITGLPYAERASRPHAHIFWDVGSQQYMIVDNQSANGTLVDGKKIDPWKPYVLRNGTQVVFGKENRIKFTVKIN